MRRSAATAAAILAGPAGYGVVTLHRPSNVDDAATLRHLLQTLRQYVAPAVVEQLLRSEEEDPLRPRRCDVTTLVADMEGYTSQVETLPVEAAATLTRDFLDCLTGPVIGHQGTLDKYTGDGMMAFWGAPLPQAEHADLALDAARPIQVRVGLHTGTPLLADEGYVGGDVHRAARMAAAGHGGQVLVSSSTERLVDTELRDLGEHRFKDLYTPEHVFQIGDQEFAPLKTLYQTNLPIPQTPFMGRERELGEVLALLERKRRARLGLEARCRTDPRPVLRPSLRGETAGAPPRHCA